MVVVVRARARVCVCVCVRARLCVCDGGKGRGEGLLEPASSAHQPASPAVAAGRAQRPCRAPTWLLTMVTPAATNSCSRSTSKLVAPTCFTLPFFCSRGGSGGPVASGGVGWQPA